MARHSSGHPKYNVKIPGIFKCDNVYTKNGSGVVLCSQGSTGSFGDLMNLKRFYDDSSVGSAENLVARAVPLSTVFCRQHHAAGSEESISVSEPVASAVPYHQRSRIDMQQQQQQQLQQNHQQMQQQQSRRYAAELHGGGGPCAIRSARQHHRPADMTSQQRIERMSRIMKQQNARPELQSMRFRHTLTLVSPTPPYIIVLVPRVG